MQSTRFNHQSIMVVEDNADHLFLIESALKKCMPGITTIGARSQQEALQPLSNEEIKASGFPKLILLDLYMPKRTDGLFILESLQEHWQDKKHPQIPIVMFSYSNLPEDIDACYNGGASAYIVKSHDYNAWVDYFTRVRDYWFETVTLPVVSRY